MFQLASGRLLVETFEIHISVHTLDNRNAGSMLGAFLKSLPPIAIQLGGEIVYGGCQMKRFLALSVALLMIPAIAFAAELPDYAKDGKLTATYSCDSGKTVVKNYDGVQQQWYFADEYRLASDDVFVEFTSDDANNGFHMKPAGSTEMKQVSHSEWDAALKAKSLAAYNYIHGGPTGCAEVAE